MRWVIAAVLFGFAFAAAADAGQIKTTAGTVYLERGWVE